MIGLGLFKPALLGTDARNIVILKGIARKVYFVSYVHDISCTEASTLSISRGFPPYC